MAVALGQTPESEAAQNLHQLAPLLAGAVGLLFTSRSPDAVMSFLDSFRPLDFARAGTVASRSFTIPNGLVYAHAGEIPAADDEPLSHTVEPALRKLGVPTRLVKGKVMLDLNDGEDGYLVCTQGETLDSRQTTLLKMFGVTSAEFHVQLKAYWVRATGEVKLLEHKGGHAHMEVDAD